MRTVSATGVTVMTCLAAARRLLGLKLKDSREADRDGEDGLYRVILTSGHVVECTIRPRTKTEAQFV